MVWSQPCAARKATTLPPLYGYKSRSRPQDRSAREKIRRAIHRCLRGNQAIDRDTRRAAQTNWLSSIALPSVAELLSAEDCLPKLGLITDHDPPITGLPTLSQNQVQSRNATSGFNRVRTFDLRIILAFSRRSLPLCRGSSRI